MKTLIKSVVIASTLLSNAVHAESEVIVLTPSDYGLFFFNNGAGRLEIVDLPSRLTKSFNCDVSFTVEFLTDSDLSDRTIAALIAARAAGADIRVQITDDGTATGANCRFNGVAIQPAP
jgi:hypothetical protein